MNKELNKIYEKIKTLSGVEKKAKESEEEMMLRGLSVIEENFKKSKAESEYNNKRVASILDVVMAMAQLDYSRKANISEKTDYVDALAAGINMLGEELKESTVSLHEKETLLKEIHHRVKNNLQIISSLLNLQSGQIDDPYFKEKYNVSRDRISSMALVHEKLYESEDLSLIDFGDYVLSLANSLNVSYNPGDSRIRMHLDVAENAGLFRIETAIPSGLILNESLSNSFKYAFPENRKGNIFVFFGCTGEKENKKEYCLSVKDDGIGLPENLTLENAETLGFQLMSILAEQLDGKVLVERKNGTKISLVFWGK
jgi:two-component sensor histidine kinase